MAEIELDPKALEAAFARAQQFDGTKVTSITNRSALSVVIRAYLAATRHVSDEAVEAAARRICAANGFDPDATDRTNGDRPQPMWINYEMDARAALQTGGET